MAKHKNAPGDIVIVLVQWRAVDEAVRTLIWPLNPGLENLVLISNWPFVCANTAFCYSDVSRTNI